jgi:hypothetical protein
VSAVCHLSFKKHTFVFSCFHIISSDSDDNGSIPQPSAWFPVLDGHSVVPVF